MNKSLAMQWLVENVTKWPTTSGGIKSEPDGWLWCNTLGTGCGDLRLLKLAPVTLYADCIITQQEWLDAELTPVPKVELIDGKAYQFDYGSNPESLLNIGLEGIYDCTTINLPCFWVKGNSWYLQDCTNINPLTVDVKPEPTLPKVELMSRADALQWLHSKFSECISTWPQCDGSHPSTPPEGWVWSIKYTSSMHVCDHFKTLEQVGTNECVIQRDHLLDYIDDLKPAVGPLSRFVDIFSPSGKPTVNCENITFEQFEKYINDPKLTHVPKVPPAPRNTLVIDGRVFEMGSSSNTIIVQGPEDLQFLRTIEDTMLDPRRKLKVTVCSDNLVTNMMCRVNFTQYDTGLTNGVSSLHVEYYDIKIIERIKRPPTKK